MNWKLIFLLSLFGLAIGLGSVSLLNNMAELICWLVSFVIVAWFIAKNASGKYFLYGFLVSMVNCVWVTAAHLLWYSTFIASHPQMNPQMPLQGHYRLNMIIIGPIVGAAFGLILGLFAFIASKLVKKSVATTA